MYNDINLNDIIKLLTFIILLFLLNFKNIYIYNEKNIINIDNNIKEVLFENDWDFSEYETNLKIIAIYYPQYLKKDFNYFNRNKFELNNKKNLLINEYKQIRKPYKYFYLGKEKILPQLIKEQIKLAKNHGIFGFGIIYYWLSGKTFDNEQINLFLDGKDINFPFFLIWKNDKYLPNHYQQKKTILIEQEYKKDDINIFVNNIRKYLISDNYIKINGKPILAIYDPLIIHNLKDYLLNLRQITNESGIGELFLLGTLYYDNNQHCKELFDACYEFPPKNLNLNNFKKNKYYYYYQGLIYNSNNHYDNKTNNYSIFKGLMLEWNTSFEKKKNPVIFNEYSPEKLYILLKIIINWTINNHNKDDNFIFINAWNNWEEGLYLEPDDYLGYSSLNALSRALFNISFFRPNYNLTYIKNICKIAVQAHIFYEDLIIDIINKTNNIPTKFDLYITTTTFEIKNKVIECINKYSKSNNYDIVILDNKGRDVLPLLIQLKNRIKYYKYFCHIHSKKSKTSPIIGKNWRNYLYNNLLGNVGIVSEIISDFENMDKLGFIYPETFYDIIELSFILTKKTKKYMKFILKKIFNKVKLGNKLDFPAGNMFWARVMAVYQIFEINFYNKFNKEDDQTNDTIMHGIERIWLYLVKLNGFFFKKIFKSHI